jgi:hypothetical protein
MYASETVYNVMSGAAKQIDARDSVGTGTVSIKSPSKIDMLETV